MTSENSSEEFVAFEDGGVGFADPLSPPELAAGVRNPQHRLIAYMAANGRDAYAISQDLELPYPSVERILRMQSVRQEIDRIQKGYFNSAKQRFDRLAEQGITFYEELMGNKVPEAAVKDKIQVVREVHNRAYGKPVERVQVESSTIRQLFERLDSQEKRLAEVAQSGQTERKIKPAVIDGEVVSETQVASSGEVKPKDEVQEWLDEFGKHTAIGKGKPSGESS